MLRRKQDADHERTLRDEETVAFLHPPAQVGVGQAHVVGDARVVGAVNGSGIHCRDHAPIVPIGL